MEQMAHFPDKLVPGLFIYSSGRRTKGKFQKAAECINCILRKRAVAWGELELRYLGSVTWPFDGSV